MAPSRGLHLQRTCKCCGCLCAACVWSHLWVSVLSFPSSYSAAKVCTSSEEPPLPCWHTSTIAPWREQKKGLAAGFKKKKTRHAWQKQYKNTSYTCSSGPVWCDKKPSHGLRGTSDSWRTCIGTAQSNSYHFSWHAMYHWAEREL